jgi:hypothetical protein
MTRRNRKLCVAIARDVLEQLRLKRYRATCGGYVSLDDIAYDHLEESFKDFFKTKKVNCDVCALGAAFVSLVNIKNECSVEDVLNNGMDRERLESVFGCDNMNLMESAFEEGPMDGSDNENEDIYSLETAAKWGNQWHKHEDRLRQIMLNVIRNNGDFKLPQKFISMANRFRNEDAYCIY